MQANRVVLSISELSSLRPKIPDGSGVENDREGVGSCSGWHNLVTKLRMFVVSEDSNWEEVSQDKLCSDSIAVNLGHTWLDGKYIRCERWQWRCWQWTCRTSGLLWTLRTFDTGYMKWFLFFFFFCCSLVLWCIANIALGQGMKTLYTVAFFILYPITRAILPNAHASDLLRMRRGALLL